VPAEGEEEVAVGGVVEEDSGTAGDGEGGAEGREGEVVYCGLFAVLGGAVEKSEDAVSSACIIGGVLERRTRQRGAWWWLARLGFGK